jgi:hypothetical protein
MDSGTRPGEPGGPLGQVGAVAAGGVGWLLVEEGVDEALEGIEGSSGQINGSTSTQSSSLISRGGGEETDDDMPPQPPPAQHPNRPDTPDPPAEICNVFFSRAAGTVVRAQLGDTVRSESLLGSLRYPWGSRSDLRPRVRWQLAPAFQELLERSTRV